MKVSLLGVGLLAIASTVGFAQAAPQAAPVQHHAATINQRSEHQQKRIAEGVRTGRLNARQGARLERKDVRIKRAEYRMRAHHHGRLNRGERMRLNHRLNRNSRAIYRAKHVHARG
jgi:hypothetical protein